MDWNNASDEQIGLLIDGMVRFQGGIGLGLYWHFNRKGVDFPLPPKSRELYSREIVREYVERAKEEGFLNQLVEFLKKTYYFVDRLPEPNWDDLSGKQLKVIREAIEKAFPNPSDFDMFLSDTFNKRPLTTQSAAAFPQQLFKFLLDVQAEGWAKDLVEGLEATKRLPLRKLTIDLVKVTS